MSLCFRSFSEGDAEDYHGSIDATEHYNRGYYDGQEDARKENEGNLDRAYRKGFEAGRKKTLEKLMKTLFDLFGDDIAVAYLDNMCSGVVEQSNDDTAHLEPALNDVLEESSYNSLDNTMVNNYIVSEPNDD